MTIKNFKIGQGLDLNGLILTAGQGELLVNGNAIGVDLTGYATESYVANALTPYATETYVDSAVGNVIPSLGGTSTTDLAGLLGVNIQSIYWDNTNNSGTLSIQLLDGYNPNAIAAFNNAVAGTSTFTLDYYDGITSTSTTFIKTGLAEDQMGMGIISVPVFYTSGNTSLNLPGANLTYGDAAAAGKLLTNDGISLSWTDAYITQAHVANVYATKQSPSFTGNAVFTNGWVALQGQETKLLFNDYANPIFLEHSLTDYNKIAIRNVGDANAINLATEAYVANAVANVSVDLSQAAGTNLTWNANTSQFDVDSANVVADTLWPYMSAPTGYAKIVNVMGEGFAVDLNGYATESYVANSISNLVDSAPETLNTLNELAAALQDNPNVITSLQDIASGKQNTLIEGLGIDIVGNTISANMPDIANAIAGSYLDYNTVGQAIDVNVYGIANAIAGTGITFDSMSGKLTAAPGFISNVTSSFVVVDGQLDLSNAISIGSVELTDTVANVTAASDVFGDASTSAFGGDGIGYTVGTISTGAEVADVFITLKATIAGSSVSRTSKLTAVFTGSDAPTWTEYGIIASGWTAPTTVSFDSSKNIVVSVDGYTFSAKGVFTILK